jgi:hypothetical protein
VNNNKYQGFLSNGEIVIGDSAVLNQTAPTSNNALRVIVQRNDIYAQNKRGTGVSVGYGVSDVIIENNYIHGCGRPKAACSYPEEPVIRIGVPLVTGAEAATRVTINNNFQDNEYPGLIGNGTPNPTLKIYGGNIPVQNRLHVSAHSP